MDTAKKFSLKTGVAISAAVVVAMLAMSAYAWTRLPDDSQMPVHWGVDGEPDRHGSKFEGLLMAPGIAAAITLLFCVIPWFEPRKLNFQRSQRAYHAIWFGILLVLTAAHGAVVLTALGYSVNVGLIVPTAIGIFFVVIGNYMGKIRSNFFMGIRTPWTLSSELSWNKTHRLGGRLFMVVGVLMLVLPWAPWHGQALVGLVGLALGMVLLLFVYSYVIWRRDPEKQTLGRQ